MADITKFSAVRDGVRGVHTLNKMHTTTGDLFRWDVVHMIPCVPKDIMNLSIHTFIDSAPNPYPINGKMKYGMYAFFVPNRIVWKDWPKYMTNLENLTQPYFTLGDLWDAFHSEDNPWAEDYFDDGIRFISNIRNLSAISWALYESTKSNIPSSWLNLKFDGYALRAINRIWFDWMRDKVHISDVALSSYCTDTGGHMTVLELIQLCAPKYRCYPKNYITTAFEAPQDGGQEVQPVRVADSIRNPGIYDTGTGAQNFGNLKVGTSVDSSTGPDSVGLVTSVHASGSSALGGNTRNLGQFDWNDLRLRNSVQQFKERLLVLGKTVLSRAKGIFNTAPTIEELQMSNYIGGHDEDLYFDTMTADVTSYNGNQSLNNTPFGYDGASAVVAGQKYQSIRAKDSNGFGLSNIQYKTDETGFLIVMGCIMPVPQYYQALPRDWFRGMDTAASDRFDYFHSDMENQPLQPVLNYEVCCNPMVSPKGVYGFQQNYIDYKLEYDTIAGDFINPSSNELYKSMHLGRDIAALLEDVADPEATSWDEYLTPAILTQATGVDKAAFASKFTLNAQGLDHFRINHRIEVVANRPMSEVTLPSIDSALSRMTPKKKVETGGFRL